MYCPWIWEKEIRKNKTAAADQCDDNSNDDNFSGKKKKQIWKQV